MAKAALERQERPKSTESNEDKTAGELLFATNEAK
jgi:hypothetical protein|tara:strand:+ start:50 stop:154 length:105 start_codon:yes stop_codon:yes gene_type:complete